MWGATRDEIARPMPGDDAVADPMMNATRAVSIDAAPGEVFPWLRQMGFKRAGWYSYDWVDNLGKESARALHPEWQTLQTGDKVPAGPISFIATVVDPDEAFCIVQSSRWVMFSLAFSLTAEAGGTRLVSRARARIDAPGGPLVAKWLLEPGDGLMVRRQLLGIKERAEHA